MTSPHEWEEYARLKKVNKLVTSIDQALTMMGIDSHSAKAFTAVVDMDLSQWATAEAAAGVLECSVTTYSMVISIYADRLKI